MTDTRSNIVLIGMPGSGKSTVGVILAKLTGRGFVDTDVLIQTAQERTLQRIVEADGYAALRSIEAAVILDLHLHHHVIATGGSAVYSEEAMLHLKADGMVVLLEVDVALLQTRVGDFSNRGLAKPPDQTFTELFQERAPLYRRYADITIDCAGLSQDAVCQRIIEATQSQPDNSSHRGKPPC